MRLFVGNLPWSVSSEELKELFVGVGEVQEAIIITDQKGRSKGFGFVEMPNDEEAKKAISALNGKEVQGRKIVVNKARPRKA